jgi:hypothetical protein
MNKRTFLILAAFIVTFGLLGSIYWVVTDEDSLYVVQFLMELIWYTIQTAILFTFVAYVLIQALYLLGYYKDLEE